MRSLDLLFFITWNLPVSVLSRGYLLVSFHAQYCRKKPRISLFDIFDVSKSSHVRLDKMRGIYSVQFQNTTFIT